MTVLRQLLIVCPLTFLAGFVDAAAGGGGLISLPAYYLAGLPPHMAAGSNKLSSSVGTVFSAGRFLKNGSIQPQTAAVSAGCALLGSWSGARLALVLSGAFLQTVMLVLLPAAAAFILIGERRGAGEVSTFRSVPAGKAFFLSGLIGLALGMYDGFFGPGTGTFLILAFTALLGFDFRTACGNTKVVNLSSNVAALATFVAAGKVQYPVAVPAAFCSVAGHWVGSGLVIRRGAKFIRGMMLAVLVLLFTKIAWDMIRSA